MSDVLSSSVSREISYADACGYRGVLTLHYNPERPLIVTVDFGQTCSGRHVAWTLARDLLADGLTRLAGLSDVQCWTADPWYYLALSSDTGSATVRMLAEPVRAFLVDAEDLVPYGAERVDVDAALDQLLKTGGNR